MYFLFGILVLISFVFVILFSRRKKKKILCRLACMNPCEKENLLNSLLGPLGFYYESRWDVISSRTDAWQKAFGYLDAYNRAAPYLSMVSLILNYQSLTENMQCVKRVEFLLINMI